MRGSILESNYKKRRLFKYFPTRDNMMSSRSFSMEFSGNTLKREQTKVGISDINYPDKKQFDF